ncbi:heat stress transcription factor A-2e-like isoform X2 [Primulina huaijiensis]|uniref:heat stress transcription factor A-2e-like isoform X2 n=1 Tax=Primulina huaijiensis TaxID=1492673 RepID=UPI003CC71AA9
MRCRDFSGDDGGGCGGGDGDGGEARGKEMPKLIERIGEMGPPPFLTKTFEIVNDPNTHSILSLCGRRSTFIVRDPHRLSTDLLPKHSDHNNFSSSVRQLNTCDHNSRMLIGADEQRGGLYYFRGLTASKAMKTIKKDTMDLWHLSKTVSRTHEETIGSYSRVGGFNRKTLPIMSSIHSIVSREVEIAKAIPDWLTTYFLV